MSPTASLIAERHRTLESSPTLALAAKARALRAAGKSVVDLTAGEPDFPTPANIKRAAVQAIEKNLTKYTPVAGVPELRQAVAKKLTARLGVAYAPAQVVVSNGAKHSLFNALQVICEPGDEVLVLTPYWVSYVPLVQLAGGRAVLVETREADGYQPDPSAVRAAVTSRTKAIILNSPSNPTGVVLGREPLRAIADMALERGLVVITDEIYDELVYTPHQPLSILQVEPRLAGQAIVVNGVPRLINQICDRVLLACYVFRAKFVNGAVVRRSYQELMGEVSG